MAGKSGITRVAIQRQWPHRVELPAVRGPENTAATWGLAKELGGAPYPLSDFHDDRHFTVFCFRTAEAAKAFHDRFGGELLPLDEDTPERRRLRR
jgi:hypothetical protein